MNMQRFRQVLAYIEAHPQEWYQFNPRPDCPHCFGAITREMFGTLEENEFLEAVYLKSRIAIQKYLECDENTASWLYNPFRTLDDFRTVARRTFA